MKKLCIYLIICTLCLSTVCTAEQSDEIIPTPVNGMIDDCADFSKVLEYSGEGLNAKESVGEDRSVFEEDFTFFQRVTTEAEWVTYEIPAERYLSVQTYFWQGEALNHFASSWSADGTQWYRANPTIKTKSVGNDKWLPVRYEFKKLPSNAKYLKISFPAQNTVEWSPVMASVSATPFPVGDGSFTDTNSTPYHEAITVLKHLGFVSGVTETEFQPSAPITRAEFCALIARMMNMENVKMEEKTIFSDVPADYWGRASIETLYHLGIVSGTVKNTFSPEEEVTFSQAIKILISVLGYTPDAELEGGYPAGYLAIAKRLHLIEKISASEQPLCRGEAALYLYRAADTKCMERTHYGSEEKYDKKAQTLLEKYHNIEKLEAVVTEAGSASITGGGILDEKYFIAGGVQYECGNIEMADFLGQRTYFYVHHDSARDIPVVLYAFSNANYYTDISYSQFVNLDENKIIYEENGREKKITVSPNTRIIYNGRYLSRVGLETELPFQNGSLRLIDNDKNGSIDILSITDYQTYFLAADAKLNSVLSDLYFGAVTIGMDDMQYVKLTRYDEREEYHSAVTVSAGDVVQAACSADGVRAEVVVLNDYTAGKIEEYSEQKQVCQISGMSYQLSDYFLESRQEIEVGADEVFAYLDSNGAIVAITYANNSQEYAYLQSISLNSAFDTEGKLRLIRESGKAEIVPFTTKTRLNGEKVKENDFLKTFQSLQPQLIQLRTNLDGSAADILTAKQNDEGTPIEREFSLDYHTTDDSIYRAGNFSLFDSIYQLSNATKVFIVPGDSSEIEKYQVGGIGLLHADFKYKAELFDLNPQYQAAAAVIYQNGSSERRVEPYDSVMIVDECSTYLNDANEYALKLTGWVNGEKTDLLFRSDGSENQTENWLPYTTKKTSVAYGNNPFITGDVIQFVKDYNGYCDKFRLLFDASQCTEEFFYEQNAGDYGGISQTNYYSELYSGYGKIERVFSGKLFFLANLPQNRLRTIMTSNAKVYRLNSKKSAVIPGELNDLEIGSRIFVRMNFTNCNEILIVE